MVAKVAVFIIVFTKVHFYQNGPIKKFLRKKLQFLQLLQPLDFHIENTTHIPVFLRCFLVLFLPQVLEWYVVGCARSVQITYI